ncbi:mucin-1-like [Penaeus indicus]|uniref:mucin-1-like n=1 Tax=Penaeus indicus TaxID=29960 RepID=UPI00300D5A43
MSTPRLRGPTSSGDVAPEPALPSATLFRRSRFCLLSDWLHHRCSSNSLPTSRSFSGMFSGSSSSTPTGRSGAHPAPNSSSSGAPSASEGSSGASSASESSRVSFPGVSTAGNSSGRPEPTRSLGGDPKLAAHSGTHPAPTSCSSGASLTDSSSSASSAGSSSGMSSAGSPSGVSSARLCLRVQIANAISFSEFSSLHSSLSLTTSKSVLL